MGYAANVTNVLFLWGLYSGWVKAMPIKRNAGGIGNCPASAGRVRFREEEKNSQIEVEINHQFNIILMYR